MVCKTARIERNQGEIGIRINRLFGLEHKKQWCIFFWMKYTQQAFWFSYFLSFDIFYY